MSVAYAYFKYMTDKENRRRTEYYCQGKTDARLIFNETPTDLDDMATCAAKDTVIKHDVIIEANLNEKPENHCHKAQNQKVKKSFKSNRCLQALFVILGLAAVVVSVTLIILAVLASITTKVYDAAQSSRMAAMVLLAVSSAITICSVIYGGIAVFKRQKRPVRVAIVVLLLLVIVQALIAGISVNVEPADEAKLLKSLTESFKLAREEHHPRHTKLWSMTQADLNCCGIYSPEDYRNTRLPYYFPPNVPISCCPTYDPSRSELVQERDRELCKVKNSYYTGGCKGPVLTVFKETSSMVLIVTIILIVFEVLLMIIYAVLCRRTKQKEDKTLKRKPLH